MVDKVDGIQSNAAAQVAEQQQRLDELEQAQRERLMADAAIERAAEVAQSEQVTGGVDASAEAKQGADASAEGFAGTEVSDLASDQQDRGESWDDFANREDDSRERAARELQVQGADGANAAKQDGEPEKINVGDLMKDLAVQSGRIKS